MIDAQLVLIGNCEDKPRPVPCTGPQRRFLGVARGATAPVRAVPSLCPLMKLVARLQGYILHLVTAWHHVADVKLHHSLNHVLCHPEFLPPPQIQIWPPAGHPKLLQLETPLLVRCV